MQDSTSKSNTAQKLRAATRAGCLQVPGAPFALAGKLIQESGFQATYVSGGAFSAGILAMPDEAIFTLTELAEHVRQLTASVSIPVIVDADTGFGSGRNVQRTVQELERAGAAAIQLEDQVLPKRCGHLVGKQLGDVDDMATKIRVAVNARRDDQTVIVARTDARGVTNFADAVDRACAYVDAGADWIFPEALTSKEEFSQFASEINVPLVANMTEFGVSPLLSVDELAELGYRVVLYPVSLLRLALKTMQTALTTLASDGNQHALVDSMCTRAELYALLGYDGLDRTATS